MTSALLVVGHGTRDPSGAAECAALADGVRAARPRLPVAVGNLELCGPTIPDAFATLVSSGATDVTALPLVLFSARHAKQDIPAALTAEQARHPGLRVRRARPLGVHPRLVDVVDDRLRARIPAEGRRHTAVVLVRAGSTDPDARPDLTRVAGMLARRGPYPVVETAFAGIAQPGIPTVLQRVRDDGFRRVAVVPYLLFAGRLAARVAQQAADFAAAHPGTRVTTTDHLGPDRRIAALLLERHDEARRCSFAEEALDAARPSGDSGR